jgi:hypothetical protein
MATKLVNTALRSLKDIEKEIKANYRTLLNDLRAELLNMGDRLSSMDEALKYNRFNTLKDKIYKGFKKVATENYKLINNNRYDVFEKSYKTEMEKFEESGIIAAWLISKILERPISGQSFKDSMKDIARNGLKKVSNKIAQGVLQNKPLSDIAADMKEAINTNAKYTVTSARTETLRAMSDGQEEGFEEDDNEFDEGDLIVTMKEDEPFSSSDEFEIEDIPQFAFVPLIGREGWKE